MGLVFIDGCKHYDVGDLLKKWGAFYGNVQVDPSSDYRRRPGTSYLSIVTTGTYVQTKALALTSRAVIGLAMKVEAASCAGAIILYSGSVAQMSLVFDTSQRLHVKRGDQDGTILASSDPATVPVGSWFYLEFDGTVHDSSGASEVRVNGGEIPALTLTGQDTKPSATAGVDRIRIITTGAYDVRLTDFYVDTDTFRGDCVVDTLLPTAAGAHDDFVPSAGANYECADDADGIDDDATYNASATQDDMDTFAFANLTAMPTSDIIAVAVNLALRKDDATTRVIKPVARIGSTDYLHGTGISPAGLYAVVQGIWEDNPADSQDWEEADVNGAEFGYKQTLVS
jgi:hypothetical protein